MLALARLGVSNMYKIFETAVQSKMAGYLAFSIHSRIIVFILYHIIVHI